MENEEIIISVNNLCKSFAEHSVLSGINLKIKKGSSFVIVGGSGTGKSVLIKTIIGLMNPTDGEVFVDGQNIHQLAKTKKNELLKKCGYLFQSGALFDSLTIEENVTFFASNIYDLTREDRRNLAKEKLESVGLTERALNLYPSELSGGMRKRAALARTICTNPEIIFFDEPTTGLDPVMSNVINELILHIKENLGATCITITHDMNTVRRISDEVAMIHEGKIIWQGLNKDIKNCDNPIVNQFFEGKTKGPIKL